MPPMKGGPHCRLSSPRGGGSTLTTSAPMSAKSIVHTGPERIRERSTTNKSSRGLIIGRDRLSESLPAIEDERHRALIRQLHVHHCLEDASVDGNSEPGNFSDELLVKRASHVGRSGMIERRPASFPAITKQRELRDHENFA